MVIIVIRIKVIKETELIAEPFDKKNGSAKIAFIHYLS